MVLGKLLAVGTAFVAYKAIKAAANENAHSSSRAESSGTRESGPSQSESNARKKKAVYTLALIPGQIRLLVNDSSASSPRTSYNFRRVNLADLPVYDVLSYTWGDKPESSNVPIGGKDFPVTDHLFDALVKHSSDHSNPPIWVDAICIEQADDDEKGVQVQQMTRVYENARQVFIWLGSGEEYTADAYKLLASFGSPDDEEAFVRAVLRSYVSRSSTRGWAGLAELLARRWWTRAWIFQEVIVAKQAVVWCDWHSCSWNTFAALASAIEAHRDVFVMAEDQPLAVARIMENHHHLYNLALYQRQRKFLSPPSLSQALEIRRQAGATDQRDKVFSLLGVCREEQALPRSLRDGFMLTGRNMPATPSGPDVRISYDKSHTVAEVYKGAARHIIQKNQHLDLLSACQNPDRRSGIPSWAPDWSVRRNNNPIIAPDIWGRPFSASSLDPNLSFKRGRNSDEIVLEGVYVDKVVALSTPRSPGTPWRDVKGSWAGLAVLCGKTRPDGSPLQVNDPPPNDGQCLYVEGETIEMAFLRTCCMDRIDEIRLAVESGKRFDPADVVGELSMRETMAREDATENRSFGITKCGLMGLFPSETKEGDAVYVFTGADVPFVVRSVSDAQGGMVNVIVGECYVQEIMYAEVLWGHGLPGRDGKGLKKEEVRLR